MMTPITAWKFLAPSRRLGHGDGRPVEVGVPLEIDGHPILCKQGIHASRRAIDALQYAESTTLARVSCEGDLVEGDDKIACTRLTPLAIIDARAALRAFARLCALDVIGMWDAPEVVRQFLVTGDERLRSAALSAALAAAYAEEPAAVDAAEGSPADAAEEAAAYVATAASAEEAAARAAARYAARAAAESAVESAYVAAYAAADAAAWFAAFNAARAEDSAAHAASWAAACAAALIFCDSSRTAVGASAAAHAAAWTASPSGSPEWYAARAAAIAAQNVRLEKMLEQAGRQPR